MSKVFTLYVQDLRQECNVYFVQVKWHSKIKDVKDLLYSTTGIPPSRQQLFQSNCAVPLSSSLTLHCLSIDRSGYTLRLSVIDTNVIGAPGFILNHAQETSLDQECSNILADIRTGLRRENAPIKTDVLDCTGGVYFMRALCGRKVAVFKPFDEEQGMPNNTKGYHGTGDSGLRLFSKPGYGCVREVAAYIMDVDNFCNVPPTMLVHCEHPILHYPEHGGSKGHPYPKLGSLQKFVHATDTFEDVGQRLLSDFEVQKVALLDLRLLNGDRNASNILAVKKYLDDSDGLFCHNSCNDNDICSTRNRLDFHTKKSAISDGESGKKAELYSLIPIDHGYCLPSKLLINELDWAWFYYPQVRHPVHDNIKQYLASLDFELLLKNMLAQVSLSEETIFLARVSHTLVVDGVAAGLTLFEIANIVVRIQEDVPSSLEKAIEEAEENAYRTIEMRLSAMSRSQRGKGGRDVDVKEALKYPRRRRASSVECSNRASMQVKLEDWSDSSSGDSDHHLKSLRFSESEFSCSLTTGIHCADKVVRLGPLCRIDESTTCTDSSGANTPNLMLNHKSDNPGRLLELCLLGDTNHLQMHSASHDEESLGGSALSSGQSTPAALSRQHRIPYIDADEALESRIGSPVTVPKCAIFPRLTSTSLHSTNAEWTATSIPEQTQPSQPSGRMKRVTTLSHVASPQRMASLAIHSCEQKSLTINSSMLSKESSGNDDSPLVGLHMQSSAAISVSIFNDILHTSLAEVLDLSANSTDTTGTDGYCNDDDDDDDMSTTDADVSSSSAPTSPTAAISFLRVTSFSAFSSAPIYDFNGAERRISKLQKERRGQIALTPEFAPTRLQFAKYSVAALISKSIKARDLTANEKEASC